MCSLQAVYPAVVGYAAKTEKFVQSKCYTGAITAQFPIMTLEGMNGQ